MMRIMSLMTVALLCLACATACGKEEATGSAEKRRRIEQESGANPSSPSETGHARAGVQPGSHEDWCAEHEVPESLCTRCNPSLVAAFKATGDWCVEHGLPESQCRLCNPDLKIERPPKTGGK